MEMVVIRVCFLVQGLLVLWGLDCSQSISLSLPIRTVCPRHTLGKRMVVNTLAQRVLTIAVTVHVINPLLSPHPSSLLSFHLFPPPLSSLLPPLSFSTLPSPSLCSFNRIDIPNYETYEKLVEKLTFAIEHTKGFHVE